MGEMNNQKDEVNEMGDMGYYDEEQQYGDDSFN